MLKENKQSPEILQELLEYLGIKAHRLAKEIGDKSNVRIYHVKNGRNNISKKLAAAITERYPEINENYLRTGVGKLLKERSTHELYINTNGNIFKETKDGSLQVTVKLVPFDDYTAYVEAIDSTAILNDWQDATFNVDQYERGNYLGFKIKNNAMNGGKLNDTPSDALVLGIELGRQYWLDGFNPSKYGWVMLTQKNIFHKDIIALDSSKGIITCHSRNPSPEFSDFKLRLNEIHQIFKVVKRTF